jgi:uncharacterized RDD family membrane protein YckC
LSHEPSLAEGLTPYTQSAAIGARVAAAAIDTILLGAGAYAISVAVDLIYSNVYATTFKRAAQSTSWGELAASIFVFVYVAGYEASARQGTIGKTFLRIRITDEKGRRISVLRSMARAIAKAAFAYSAFLSLFVAPVLALVISAPLFVTNMRQGLHDLAAGTLVLKGPPTDAEGRQVY